MSPQRFALLVTPALLFLATTVVVAQQPRERALTRNGRDLQLRSGRSRGRQDLRLRSGRSEIRCESCGKSYKKHRKHRCRPVREYTYQQVWIKGYHRTVTEKIQEPGCYERVWVDDGPAFRASFGGFFRAFWGPRHGHWEKVWRPGEVRYVTRNVWVPGHYDERKVCRTRGHRHGSRRWERRNGRRRVRNYTQEV